METDGADGKREIGNVHSDLYPLTHVHHNTDNIVNNNNLSSLICHTNIRRQTSF